MHPVPQASICPLTDAGRRHICSPARKGELVRWHRPNMLVSWSDGIGLTCLLGTQGQLRSLPGARCSWPRLGSPPRTCGLSTGAQAAVLCPSGSGLLLHALNPHPGHTQALTNGDSRRRTSDKHCLLRGAFPGPQQEGALLSVA